jgi:hypothetical protein
VGAEANSPAFDGGRDADGLDHPMELDFSRAIALDRAERLYVCDSGDHHIHVFERDGTPAGTFGEFGQDADDLNRPIALAIDNQDDVHIVDQGNWRVQVFDNGGQYQRSYGAYGSDVGQFILPRAIAIDSSGRSYVADAAGFRIVVFAPDGRPIDEIAVRFEDRRRGFTAALPWVAGIPAWPAAGSAAWLASVPLAPASVPRTTAPAMAAGTYIRRRPVQGWEPAAAPALRAARATWRSRTGR